MTYLVQSPSGVTVTGDTLFDAVFSTAAVRPDYKARRVIICGQPDTITFSDEPKTGYHGEELNREMASRALTLLRRCGYTLFRSVDAD